MAANSSGPGGPSTRARIGSFIGWAFLLSIAIHAVLLPFIKLKTHTNDKQETEKVSVEKKIRVQPPTPPPPPPTPPPKSTPPPVKQTNPPPVLRRVIHPPKQTAQSKSGPSEKKADVSQPVSQEGSHAGTATAGPAAPAPAAVSTAPPAPPAPTPTPKPACANPNAPATIKGSAVEPEYPDVAREQGAVGTAQIKVTLGVTGTVTDVSVAKSAGNAALDKAAMDAAKSTSYIAETVNCVPTAGSYLFQADFTGQ